MENTQDFYSLEQIMPEADRLKQERIEDFQEVIRAIDNELPAKAELERKNFSDVLSTELRELSEAYGHLNQEVLVSGVIQAGYFDEMSGEDTREVRTASSERMLSAGFGLQRTSASEGAHLQLGHLFLLPDRQNKGIDTVKLVEHHARYFAFAPYGTVVIDTEPTDDQRIEFLQNKAPELIDKIDEKLLGLHNSLSALLQLRQLPIDTSYVESGVANQLITYVRKVVDFDSLPLLELKLQGLRRVNLGNVSTLTMPYDSEEFTGGGTDVVGRVRSLHLVQYQSYVEGEIYTSDTLHWGVSVTVEAAKLGDERFVGQEFEVCIADIRNAKPVQPRLDP